MRTATQRRKGPGGGPRGEARPSSRSVSRGNGGSTSRLCLPPERQPWKFVFKASLWRNAERNKSQSQASCVVFLGQDAPASARPLLAEASRGGVLPAKWSAAIQAGLRRSYGDDFRKILTCGRPNVPHVYIDHAVHLDDTVSTVKAKISAYVPGWANDGSRHDELTAWRTYRCSDLGSTAEAFVERCMRGRPSIDSLELTRNIHLFFDVSSVKAPARKSGGVSVSLSLSLGRQQAAEFVKQRLMAHGQPAVVVTDQVGSRLARLGRPAVIGANPFIAPVRVDGRMVNADGSAAQGFYDVTHDDDVCLEAYLPSHDEETVSGPFTLGGVHVEFATLTAVTAHVASSVAGANRSLPARIVNGHVLKYFPGLVVAGTGGAGPKGSAAKTLLLASDALIQAAAGRAVTVTVSPEVLRVECSMQRVAVRVSAPPLHQPPPSTAAAADLLYEIFASLRASYQTPVIKHHDGGRAMFKLHRDSVTRDERHGGIPQTLLTQLTSVGSIVKNTQPYVQIHMRAQRPPDAQAPGPGPGTGPDPDPDPSFVVVRLKADLSVQVARSYNKFDFAQPKRARGLADMVNESVLKDVQKVLSRIDAFARVADMRDLTELWSDAERSRMVESVCGQPAQEVRMRCIASLTGGLPTPSPSALETAVERMSPFFCSLGSVNGVLILQFRRTDGFRNPARVPLLVRLMQGQPEATVMAEIARSFGTTPVEAETLYRAHKDAETYKRMRFFVALRIDDVPFVMLRPMGRIGFEASLHNVRGLTQCRRIVSLLQVLLISAANGDAFDEVDRALLDAAASSSSSSSAFKLRKRRINDGDEQEEEEEDGGGGETGGDDIDDLIADMAEVNVDVESDRTGDPDDARGNPSPGDGGLDMADAGGVIFDDLATSNPEKYVLMSLYRADPALFRFKGSGYTTSCGHSDGRQPIVMSVQEKKRIDDEFPGSYTDSVQHGSTPALAAKNVYMCPKVWCPKSRVSMTDEQLAKAGNTCPGGPEDTPIRFDRPYFKGRERFVGFLEQSKHPQRMCMPCCFRLPGKRRDTCSQRPPAAADEDVGVTTTTTTATATTTTTTTAVEEDRERDGRKYIRGDVAPLEEGRFGILPRSMSMLFGGNSACGNRTDGSGQIIVSTDCYVRVGSRLHQQGFLSCVVSALDNSELRSVEDLVDAIASNLGPDTFVTLNDGQLCRVYMQQSDVTALLRDREATDQCVRWLARHREGYVTRFGLERVVKAMAAGTGARDRLLQAQVARELLIHDAFRRFVVDLRDDAIVKTHLQMMDLVSRPLPWLNPHRINVVLFERPATTDSVTSPDDERLRVYLSCPARGSSPQYAWRLADPVVIMLRQDAHYETVQHIVFQKRGVQQVLRHAYDSDKHVHDLVNRYLRLCSHGDGGALSRVVSSLIAQGGARAKAQVLDFSFRTVGVITTDDLYVPLPRAEPMLIGHVGASLDVRYVSDILQLRPRLTASRCQSALQVISNAVGEPDIAPRAVLRVNNRVAAIVCSNNAVVPIDLHPEDAEASGYMDALNAFVGMPFRDARISLVESARERAEKVWALRSKIVRTLRSDAGLSQEILNLRSSHHPFPKEYRRRRVSDIVRRISGDGVKAGDRVIEAVADMLMFGQQPFSLRQAVAVDTKDAVVINDTDVLTGALDRLLRNRRSRYEHPLGEVQPFNKPTSSKSLSAMWYSVAPEASSSPAAKRSGSRSSSKSSSKSKSSSGTGRRQALSRMRASGTIRNVLLFPAVHLAHRLLRSDASMPFQSLIEAVRNSLSREYARDRSRLLQRLKDQGHPSLGRLGKDAGLDAVLAPTRTLAYVPHLYDLEVLADACDVPIVVVPAEGSNDAVLRFRSHGGRLGPQALVLRRQNDAFDLLLPPESDDGSGLLFSSKDVDRLIATL
jgi:hypothetical protein